MNRLYFRLTSILIFFFLIIGLKTQAQNRFQFPLTGTYGTDYIIVNYVDWGKSDTIKDHFCLDKTYNGHQGTDITIKNFKAMDAGVDVHAVDSGVVIFVQDGVFDRETVSDTAKRLGNYVGISHNGKLQTYYAHLKKNSIVVSKGDRVVAGQVIGQIGSSGNSSSPHLHFELWYDSLYYIDPFSGPCGNKNSYWKNGPFFDSSFQIWDKGITNFKPSLDTLKEGLSVVDTIYKADSIITTWSLMYGLRNKDSLTTKWFTPTGNLWFQYSNQLKQNWWYYYYWTFINTSKITEEGKWKVSLSRNGKEVQIQSFYFLFVKDTSEKDTTTSLLNIVDTKPILKTIISQWVLSNVGQGGTLKVLDLNGKEIGVFKEENHQINIERKEFKNGVYFLVLELGNQVNVFKVYNGD